MHILCHTEDALKLEFCLDAMDAPNPFDDGTEVPESIRDAIRYDHVINSCSVALATAHFHARWYSQRSACEVIKQRESMIRWIEKKGSDFW